MLINYDFINAKVSDQFYVWVDIERKNGVALEAKAISGDVGPKVKSGSNKQIVWDPEKDAFFLNEEILVEVKAERYVRSYNKGSAMLLSAIMPGLGQTKVSGGKPYWLTGAVTYGLIGGGLLVYSSSINSYNSYKTETDPVKRLELFNTTQDKLDMSGILLASGAAIWAVNMIWVAATPNRFKPLKYVKVSMEPSVVPGNINTQLSMKINF